MLDNVTQKTPPRYRHIKDDLSLPIMNFLDSRTFSYRSLPRVKEARVGFRLLEDFHSTISRPTPMTKNESTTGACENSIAFDLAAAVGDVVALDNVRK